MTKQEAAHYDAALTILLPFVLSLCKHQNPEIAAANARISAWDKARSIEKETHNV